MAGKQTMVEPEKVSGRVEKFESAESQIQAVVLGSYACLFHLVLDVPYKLRSGTGQIDRLPIRLESGIRIPNLDGATVKVVGVYDDYDTLMDANELYVEKLNFSVAGVRRLSFSKALFACIGAALFAFLGYIVAVMLIGESAISIAKCFEDNRTCGGAIFASATTTGFVLVIYVLSLVVGWFLARVAISSMLKHTYRLVRVITEYRTKAAQI